MTNFEQRHEEAILYRQAISNDVIVSADWSILPADATATLQETTATDTTAMVAGLTPDNLYTVSVLLTLASGQILNPVAYIRCNG
jgi:hypothetical protein